MSHNPSFPALLRATWPRLTHSKAAGYVGRFFERSQSEDGIGGKVDGNHGATLSRSAAIIRDSPVRNELGATKLAALWLLENGVFR